MKRIILSVFAAAVTAAWAVPASAVDITFSGQYRLRTEWRDDVNFNKDVAPGTQDDWAQRVRLTANVKATDDTSVKITLQDSRVWGTEGLATGGGPNLTTLGTQGNRLDLHEAYLNVDNVLGAPVTLRAGRQELVYGDQRLIGNFNWSNEARAFDALKVMYASDIVNVDAFWSKLNDNNVLTADAASGGSGTNDADFYGIYATVKAIPNNTLDIYVLNLSGSFVSNVNGRGNLTTIGARLNGAIAGLDYTLELPYENGSNTNAAGGQTTNAWAAAAKVGYSIPGAPAKIRVGAEYDYAEGTSNGVANGDSSHTFFNLFPTNHNKFGIMDLAAWRNISALNVNVTAQPTDKLGVYFAWWNLNKASAGDHWYQSANWNNLPGGALQGATSHKSIGNEIDLVGTYKYNNALTAEAGYGHFFVGDVVTDTQGGSKADQDYGYLMLTASF